MECWKEEDCHREWLGEKSQTLFKLLVAIFVLAWQIRILQKSSWGASLQRATSSFSCSFIECTRVANKVWGRKRELIETLSKAWEVFIKRESTNHLCVRETVGELKEILLRNTSFFLRILQDPFRVWAICKKEITSYRKRVSGWKNTEFSSIPKR